MSATPEQIAELCERLRTELTGYEGLLVEAADALTAQAERVRVLEEALKPFAYAADGVEPGDYDALIVAWIGNAEPNNGGAYGLHASDFRRARAALKAAP